MAGDLTAQLSLKSTPSEATLLGPMHIWEHYWPKAANMAGRLESKSSLAACFGVYSTGTDFDARRDARLSPDSWTCL